MKYIDVSEWQGVIDWETARYHIDGAILRAGYGRGNADKQFARNAKECNRLSIPCGAYWFSYALSADMARAEARALLAAVRPYRMELPLAFDFEYDSVDHAVKKGVTVDKALASELVRAFCETVEAGGYWCLNYANPDYLARYFDESIPKRFGLWLASWPSAKVYDTSKPPRSDCQLWQHTSKGSVPGISGNVDTNESYKDFKKLITAAGLNRLGYPEEDSSVIFEYTNATPAVPARPWYADAMAWMRENGLYTEDRPNDTVTRAELATVIQRLCTGREAAYDPELNRASGLLTDE